MEVRHISRKKKDELQGWLIACENYCGEETAFLDKFNYESLRKKGDRLRGNFEVLRDAVSTPKAKREKDLLIDDIDFALDLIDKYHQEKTASSKVEVKMLG